MALYGIVSDIHGNLEALCAAAASLQLRGVDRILCLGDIVGYNADPDACVRAIDALSMIAVAGNHDRIAAGLLGTERCSAAAAYALRRTRRALSREGRRALAALPTARAVDGDLVLTHGSVDDVQERMTTPARVAENAARLGGRFPGARVCFFGHTHAARVYEVHGGACTERFPAGRTALAEADARSEAPLRLDGADRIYFVNPGSIDAARKEGARFAEFAIFDTALRALWLHRVRYDAERSERHAVAGGYRMTGLGGRLFGAAHAFRRRERALWARLLGAASPRAGRG